MKAKLKRIALALLIVLLAIMPFASAKYLSEDSIVWSTKLGGLEQSELEERIADAGVMTDSDYLTDAVNGGVITIGTEKVKTYANVPPADLAATIELITEKTLKSTILNMFPVGYIFMNTSGANPSTFLGGTWEAWGAGRVPVGVDNGAFAGVETTGGTLDGTEYSNITLAPGSLSGSVGTLNPGNAAFNAGSASYNTSAAGVTVNNPANLMSVTNGTLSRSTNLAVSVTGGAMSLTGGSVSRSGGSFSVNGHELTVAQLPKHSHPRRGWWTIRTGSTSRTAFSRYANAGGDTKGTEYTGGGGAHSHGATVTWPAYSVAAVTTNHNAAAAHSVSVTQPGFTMTGFGVSHNIVHTAVAVWPSFSYTAPSLSYNAPSLGAHSLSTAGASASAAATDNTLQPFITCYMWKRIA